MPPLNTRRRQPLSAFWYTTLPALFVSPLIALLRTIFSTSFLAGACTQNDCGITEPIVALFTLGIIVILAFPRLYYVLFTYEISEHTITVNSGILFRQYETIDFGKIQAIDNERGPLLMLFGLTLIRIWTASADQLTSGLGKEAVRIKPRPDMTLILGKDDAAAVRDFAMRSMQH